jgi:hypothetical protein
LQLFAVQHPTIGDEADDVHVDAHDPWANEAPPKVVYSLFKKKDQTNNLSNSKK